MPHPPLYGIPVLAAILLLLTASLSACSAREEPVATPTTTPTPAATATRAPETPAPTETPAASPTPAPTATPTPEPHVRYNVDPKAPVREGSLVELGINMAEAYAEDALGGAVHRQILVIVTTEALCIHGAVTIGYEICINVGNKSWQALTDDWFKVKVAAHEYFHVWQHELRCYREPKWLFEGAPEYLAYRAIIANGLVDPVAASVAQQMVLRESPALPPLDAFEVSYAAPAEAHYALWYFAVERLLEGREPGLLDDFCRKARDEDDWRVAFADVFGETPGTFYEAFAAWRADFLPTGREP